MTIDMKLLCDTFMNETEAIVREGGILRWTLRVARYYKTQFKGKVFVSTTVENSVCRDSWCSRICGRNPVDVICDWTVSLYTY